MIRWTEWCAKRDESLLMTKRNRSRLGQKLDADATIDLDRVGGFLGQTGCFVDFIDPHFAAILAGNQHPLATRRDVEVARNIDVASDVSCRR